MTYFLSDPAGIKALDEVREYRLYRYEPWIDTAIHRAVHRIAREGALDISVERRRDWRDRTTYQIIGCRLVLPCKNKNMQSNTYTESA